MSLPEKSVAPPPSLPKQYLHVPELLPRPVACAVPLSRRGGRALSTVFSCLVFCVISYFTLSVLHIQLIPSSSSRRTTGLTLFDEVAVPPPPAEAYVTFLASANENDAHPWYFNAVRRLLFQLKDDPITKDALRRDFVVIATPGVPDVQIAQLESEGAIVHRRPLITELPLPEGLTERYKEVYTKLFVFNMTDYRRVLFLDADQLLVKPLDEVWLDPNSWPESGLAACGESKSAWDHPTPIEDQDYLNSGFFLARPNETLFERLVAERDFDSWFPEQGLLNHYFRRDGDFPWLPLNHRFVTTFPSKVDLDYGIYALHDKMWLPHLDRELKEVWRQAMGRMEGWWLVHHGPNGWQPTKEMSETNETYAKGGQNEISKAYESEGESTDRTSGNDGAETGLRRNIPSSIFWT